MKILILSDLHISRNTPWSKDWEDVEYLIRQLQQLKMKAALPCFEAAILCGDMFNTPRILPGDAVRLVDILRILGVADKRIGWINGNHDPGDFNIAELLENSVNLNEEPLFDLISGHSYSQNIEEVRDWLKSCKYPVTVTHQSASMFMKFGEQLRNYQILDRQLHAEDFHAPVNFIGDTHVTDAFSKGEVTCISPGILVPMRSRKELLEAAPQIMVWDIPRGVNGGLEVKNSSIDTLSLKKRPAKVFQTQEEVDAFDWKSYAGDIKLLAFVSAEDRQDLDFSKWPEDAFRIVEYATPAKAENVLGAIVEEHTADTLEDIMAAADELLPDDVPNRDTILELTKNMLGVEDPDVIVKNYLEGK